MLSGLDYMVVEAVRREPVSATRLPVSQERGGIRAGKGADFPGISENYSDASRLSTQTPENLAVSAEFVAGPQIGLSKNQGKVIRKNSVRLVWYHGSFFPKRMKRVTEQRSAKTG